jgi:hypothetical protein
MSDMIDRNGPSYDRYKKKLYPLVAPLDSRYILVHVTDTCDCGLLVVPDDILRNLSTRSSRP